MRLALALCACCLALAAVAVAVAGPGAGTATADCTVGKSTAYDNEADGTNTAFMDSNNLFAQSFKVPTAVTLDRVAFYLKNESPTSDSVSLDIRSDSGGHPDAVLGTNSQVLSHSDLRFDEFDFASQHISLAPGVTYWIVVTNASATSEGYSTKFDPSGSYPDGFRSVKASGGAFVDHTAEDMLFRVFGQACTSATQPGGGAGTGTGNPVLAAASGVGFSDSTFAAESSGPPATNARKKVPKGTTVSYTLNEAASVRFTVRRVTKGRKVKRGKKTVCVKRTRKNRKNKRCKRLVTLNGSFARNGLAGKNSFHFTGRLNGRKLRPGRYRLVASPSVNGQRGKAASAGFRIVR